MAVPSLVTRARRAARSASAELVALRPRAPRLSSAVRTALFARDRRASRFSSAALAALMSLTATALAAAQPPAEPQSTLVLLDARNQPLAPERSLGVSRHITHDRALPRGLAPHAESADDEAFRIALTDPAERRKVVYARLESTSARGERHGLLRHVPLARVDDSAQFRSPFLRLISDATDSSAPDVGDQLLRVQLGDTVRATIEGSSPERSVARTVGTLTHWDEQRSPLEGTLHLSVLRIGKGGPPSVGDNVAQALTLARRQVEIANEIWAQCFIHFGSPANAIVRVVDPPPPSLLSIADLDGFPTAGEARITFRANGRRIGPVIIPPDTKPERTATFIARALRESGFAAHVTTNPRAELGADASADVTVRDARGALVELTRDGDTPLSSDPQQTIAIGTVDLSDGVDEFDNTLAATGTLEERTLVKLLADDDPSTIDVFLVNRFVNRARQGEAFIEADGSSMANTLIFDRNAVRFERQAWVQAHELGHILLDEAFHPDNIGVDRPWLLMDADARQGRVVGPKRVSDEECRKARRRSGPRAHPPILRFTPAK